MMFFYVQYVIKMGMNMDLIIDYWCSVISRINRILKNGSFSESTRDFLSEPKFTVIVSNTMLLATMNPTLEMFEKNI